MAEQITNHVEQALARQTYQFKDKTNMASLITALLTDTQDIEDALWQLYAERSIETAVGEQLDVIGRIVGEPRGGLSDADYKPLLRARIAANRSSGTVENLILIARLAANDSSLTIQLVQSQPASVTVTIHSNIGETLSDTIIRFLKDGKAAGVKLVLEYLTAEEDKSFSFSSGTFLNGAHSIGAGTLTVDDTTNFPDSGTLDLSTGTSVEETHAYSAKTATTFTLTGTLANNHDDNTAVYIPPSSKQGWGDEAVSGVGGKHASAKD